MQTTSFMSLNIVEGTDIVNPLTQTNPNFNNIDNDCRDIFNRTICQSTCVKTGTNHAISRSNLHGVKPAYSILKFNPTGNFMVGDTVTVDGVSVTVVTADNQTAGDNAFVAGIDTIAGYMPAPNNKLVLFTARSEVTPTASDIIMTNGDSVQDNIDRIGNVIRVFESGDYAAGTPWVLPADAQAVIDAGIPFLVEADFHYGAYASSKLTKLTTRGFGAHVGLVLDRTDPQVGMVRLSATSFDAYGFDLSHAPILHNLYIFPLAAY